MQSINCGYSSVVDSIEYHRSRVCGSIYVISEPALSRSLFFLLFVGFISVQERQYDDAPSEYFDRIFIGVNLYYECVLIVLFISFSAGNRFFVRAKS